MRNLQSLFFASALLLACSCGKKNYESAENDLLDARVYKLENGLTVCMSVNKAQPRIQAYVGVRVGSKNDPATSTGLAHYFEHLMFKGTSKIGTKDWEKEKPLLDNIEELFEVYRVTSDSLERKNIYHQIDSISHEASKYAIANEYWRIMGTLGSQGTNAWTSSDMTVYVEDVPSNELANWAKVQGERFSNPVIRIFHTELETVYEEKNMYLSSDNERVLDTLQMAVFPFHTYGTQSILGSDNDLKNPSIKNIKKFYEDYYVPNNMVVSLAGDFNPDSALAVIKANFGDLKPKEVKKYAWTEPEKDNLPQEKTVYGRENDYITIAFRLPGSSQDVTEMADVLSDVLYNGTAGIIDLNVNQKQGTHVSYAWTYQRPDYSMLVLGAEPKQGQSLQELKDILFAQIDSLRQGNFGDWLMPAVNDNRKKDLEAKFEDNGNRANEMVRAFINDVDWKTYVAAMNEKCCLTKQQVVDYAKKYLNENYAVVYKRQDEKFTLPLFSKPEITPVEIDKESESEFYAEIKKAKLEPIAPVFPDTDKDIIRLTTEKNLPVLYVNNAPKDLFELYYLFDFGERASHTLKYASRYMEKLGTSEYTAADLRKEMYKLACTFYIRVEDNRTYVCLKGIEKNREKAMMLMEKALADVQPDEEIFKGIISQEQTGRKNNLCNFNTVSSFLWDYLTYGKSAYYVFTDAELVKMKSEDLIQDIHSLNSYKHTVMYYGPASQKDFIASLSTNHITPETLKDIPVNQPWVKLPADKPTVYMIDYPSKQTMIFKSAPGERFDQKVLPLVEVYNGYIGSRAFSELREAKGLAYTATSFYWRLKNPTDVFSNCCYIGTQPDKLVTALESFDQLLSDTVVDASELDVAKDLKLSELRTLRCKGSEIFFHYLWEKRMGFTTDPDAYAFEHIPSLTADSIKAFQKTLVPLRYNYGIVGTEKDIDMNYLKGCGQIKKLEVKEVFGY